MSGLESSELRGAERARWPGQLSLALGVLVGPSAALTNQAGIYIVSIWACRRDLRAVVHIVPALCLLVVTGAGVSAYLNWRAVGDAGHGKQGAVIARTRFLAQVGVAISALSALVVLAQWFAVFMFGPCSRA